MTKVSIIVLNWNNYEDTKECLESLKEITYSNYEIIIVDNGSKDGSTQRLQKEFPEHTYIYNKQNLGFAGGNNVGIKYAVKKNADHILILNNDVIVERSFLEPLVEDIKSEEVGIVGPAIYFYNKPEKLYSAGRKINYWKGTTAELIPFWKVREVDSIAGCCTLIKKGVIKKIGYFYEPYFLNLEETEYCLRAKKAGLQVLCEPRSKIWHRIRSTIDKIPATQYYYFYRNKLLFTKRNAPSYVKYLFYFYFSFYLIYRSLEKLVKRDRMAAFSIRNALIDFWKGNFGKGNPIKKYE